MKSDPAAELLRLTRLIREHRKIRDLTQAELAGKLGVSRMTYQRVEGGRGRLSRELLERICAIIGCNASLLLSSAGYKFTEGDRS